MPEHREFSGRIPPAGGPDWRDEIRRRLTGSPFSARHEAALVEELAQHLEDRYAELRSSGAGEEEAIRETLAELAEEDLVQQVRGMIPRSQEETPLGGTVGRGAAGALWSDLRHGFRLLRRNPLYASLIVLTLALGIGANTAIFSIVNTILLRPSPFVESDRLLVVWETDRNSATNHEPASWPDVRDFDDRSRTIEGFGALMGVETTWLPPGGDAERVSALGVTYGLPPLLGVRPLMGRLFTQDEIESGEPVALISEGFWRSRLGARDDAVGTRLLLNDRETTIVGVLPRGSDLGITQIHAQADYTAPHAGGAVEVWLGIQPTEQEFPRQTHPLLTIGRLAPGATLEEARDELAGIASDLEAAYPENDGRGVNLEPLDEVVFGSSRPVLLLLLAAVGLVLLVTCANVANLTLTRGVSRRREMAIRMAMGARAGRMALQFLSETLVVTALGAAVGVALAYAGLRTLVAFAPAAIPRIGEVNIDGRVLVFTAAVALLVAVAIGFVPLVQARRSDVRTSLQGSQNTRVSEGPGSRKLRTALVVLQTTLAVALVTWAGLLVRSSRELQRVDPGFRTAGVLKAEYQLPPTRYPLDFAVWPNIPEINDFHAELLARVAAIPGVESAAVAGSHPLDPGVTNSFEIVGREAESADLPEIRTRFVSASYGETLAVPLYAGRALEAGDAAGTTPVAVINRTAADRYFGNRDPLGERMRFWGVDWLVVGVIGDERFLGVDRESDPAIYVPIGQAPQNRATLLVRSAVEPMGLVPQIRAVMRDIDPRIALYGVEPLTTTVTASLGGARFTSLLMTLFGGLAIVLALVGLHGVLSYTVSQRKKEIGIRMALGASPGNVRGMVVREGLALALAGVLFGAAIALLGSRLLSGLLYGVAGTDVATFAAVTAVTLAAAGVACWLPARRATSTDPLTVLNTD